ncbi:MAG TPA: aminoacyl-tRNA hydrolase [Candidatus Hydrogenedentes bacterium]|nr:aminoacyl-tRNA hydrolase [Candidatus Hydrogenedentota bacterium]
MCGSRLVVGLGNPGAQYRDTRHNLGFRVADRVAAGCCASFDREKHEGLWAEGAHAGHRVYLLKPLTFMNLSGNSVARAARSRGVAAADILVVADDVNLPLGAVRLRGGGGAGGHNGLKSVIERLGTNEFHRVRLGVGGGAAGGELSGHVLGAFRPDERAAVDAMVEDAAAAVLLWVEMGIEAAMNRHNRRPRAEEG